MSFKTADISDEFHPQVQYVEPIFKSYGGCDRIQGKIFTIKCFEDNSIVKEMVAKDGKNKIMVVDAGGSKRCAMLGDILAAKAVKNNWAGIIIYGLIRDSEDIKTMNLGVWALGTLPLKSVKLGVGEKNLELNFAGVKFKPDDYLYADADGIILTKQL